MTLILVITFFVYLSIILFTKHRIAITLIGSGLLLIIGVITESYDVAEAFAGFPSEIIILIIVLTMFTSTFEQMHFIDYIGYQFLRLTKKKKILIMVFIPLLVYSVSLFMNNLTVVLLFSTIALHMIIEFELPVVPLLVSIIIGSNIGGAPLPWADTPAVVLTLYSDFTLIDFLNKLFIPCLIFAITLSVYSYIWYKRQRPEKRECPFAKKPNVNFKKLRKIFVLFFIYIVCISIGPFYDVSLAYISLFFGGVLLCLREKDEMLLLGELPIMDSIVFLIALFLIAGVLQASGALSQAAQYIVGLTNNNMYLITLAILLLAFVTSTFLSAGPAAATLLPICNSLVPLVPFKLIYAALALGILCGSSMLPWSATGGPIMLSQTRNFIERHRIKEIDIINGIHKPVEITPSMEKEMYRIYSLPAYLKFSVPFSLLMLATSALYLIGYLKIMS